MLLLVSGATRFPRNAEVGHLIVPRQWSHPDALDLSHPFAFDNGCFVGFDAGAYMRMLEAYQDKRGALFVTAPDAVGDAASTRYRWPFWSKVIRSLGQTPAFVAQDGLRPDQVPWDEGIVLFIGGSTHYKDREAPALMAIAKARGVWVHVGRVNGRRRYELMQKAGADSIDGSGFSMYPDTNIPLAQEWHRDIVHHPELPL